MNRGDWHGVVALQSQPGVYKIRIGVPNRKYVFHTRDIDELFKMQHVLCLMYDMKPGWGDRAGTCYDAWKRKNGDPYA